MDVVCAASGSRVAGEMRVVVLEERQLGVSLKVSPGRHRGTEFRPPLMLPQAATVTAVIHQLRASHHSPHLPFKTMSVFLSYMPQQRVLSYGTYDSGTGHEISCGSCNSNAHSMTRT